MIIKTVNNSYYGRAKTYQFSVNTNQLKWSYKFNKSMKISIVLNHNII